MRSSKLRVAVLAVGLLASSLLVGATPLGTALGPVVAPSAEASISTAATLEGLVNGAHVVALAEAEESRTEWEGGRIVTLTRLHVVEKIGGEAPETLWVKSLGGMVGDIGQSVEGEPSFAKGARSLVFLRRITDKNAPDLHVVVSRAQGQYPLALEKARWMVRAHSRAGTIVPPRESANTPAMVLPKVAAMVRLQNRPVDEVLSEVRSVWSQLHAKKTP